MARSPWSPVPIPEITSAAQRGIIVCDQGYSSSLAAATLRQLGLRRATDLVGGFQAILAWRDEVSDGEAPPR